MDADFKIHSDTMSTVLSNLDIKLHRFRMKRVLRGILYCTTCHGCGRKGVPVVMIGYGGGRYCAKRPCYRISEYERYCRAFGEDCEVCVHACPFGSPSLAHTNYHNGYYGRPTTWPMIIDKTTGWTTESKNACIAERNPIFIPWVRGFEDDPWVDTFEATKHDEWFLSKKYLSSGIA